MLAAAIKAVTALRHADPALNPGAEAKAAPEPAGVFGLTPVPAIQQ